MAAFTLRFVDSSKYPCSIPWFRSYMGLNGEGIVPSVTPEELMPPRVAVAMFCGPKTRTGYFFDNHGNSDYEVYVRALFARVLQMKWPVNSVLPLRFAQGLVAEAMDIEVNWAEFAFVETHPHQILSGEPRILTEFEGLLEPLEPLNKVNPVPNFKVQVKALEAGSSHAQVLGEFTTTEDRFTPSLITSMEEDIKPKFTTQPADVPISGGSGSDYNGTRMCRVVMNGLSLLRPGIIKLIDEKSVELRTARHFASGPVTTISLRLKEEEDRLRHVNRILAEKKNSRDRAVQEHEKSRVMLSTARDVARDVELINSFTKEMIAAAKSLVGFCESVEKSSCGNADVAHRVLGEWELKSHRLSLLVVKVNEELAAAEAKKHSDCCEIDKEMEKIVAVSRFLKRI